MCIAEAAIAAGEQDHGLADLGEVGDQRLVVVLEDLRADGHAQHHVLAFGAVAVLAHAVGASRGLEVLLVAVVDERVEPIDALDHDVAAASAIAAIGPAELDEFFAQEADGPGAAVARSHIDLGLVEEFHATSLGNWARSSQRARVSRVSIWRTSWLRARQWRVELPVSVKPSFFWTASEARLKAKTPEASEMAPVTSKYQPIAAAAASVMNPRFQNGSAN